MLNERIYYIDSSLLDLIERDFELVDCDSWYKLYRNKSNGTYWRLDVWDKFQEQYWVQIDDFSNWKNFDATNLKIELLKNIRGESENICIWRGCSNKALSQLVFCKHHAFVEMGIRR